jgi:hypothetical protein
VPLSWCDIDVTNINQWLGPEHCRYRYRRSMVLSWRYSQTVMTLCVYKNLIFSRFLTYTQNDDCKPMKSLTGDVSLKVGPLVLEVLVKHWFDRLKKDFRPEDGDLDAGARLKEDDILYHQAFVIAKVSAIYLVFGPVLNP